MAREKITRFRCGDCPDCFTYGKFDPMKVPGALLKPGGRYCRGGKKTIEFKRCDTKVYPPAWCPKLKNPAEYRVYDYKDISVWHLHQLLRAQGLQHTPRGSEFAVRIEGQTALSARDFWREVEFKSPSEVLDITVHDGEVIEIDDGLRPCFFHFEDRNVKVLAFFQSEKARANQYEEQTTP